MTPRQRIKNLLARRPTDRVPCGLGGCETAGLHQLAYEKLKGILGVQDGHNRMGSFMSNAVFEPDVLRALGGDLLLVTTFLNPSALWGPGAEAEWKDLDIWDTTIQVPASWEFHREEDGTFWWDKGWGKAKCPPGALYFDHEPPERPRSFLDKPVPSPDDFQPRRELPGELLRRLEEQARWLHENTEFALVCGERVSDLQLCPGGKEVWWMTMADQPTICHEFLGKACEAAVAQLRQLDQAVGKYCCMLQIADDIGDTRGVTVGPDLWREIYKPHYKALFGAWHEITDMKVSLHCCGAVSEILGDLIECGVDVFNPIQISAADMAPAVLKRRHGRDVVFYGGAYDAVAMGHMDADDVYRLVQANIRTLSEGGGYLFAGVHNLPGDMPESHIRAMLQAWRDCRDEPELCGAGGE